MIYENRDAKKQQIKGWIKDLSRSQGLYCRLLEAVEENDEILEELVDANLKDALDLVFFIEC